jgi:hypothetical protein
MNFKKIVPVFAMALGLSSLSFAVTPETTTPVAAKSESKAGLTLKWYVVTFDATHPNGYIPSGTPIAVTGDQSDAEMLDQCDPGSTRDCLRGFISTPSLPTNNNGDGQVKTDEQPF